MLYQKVIQYLAYATLAIPALPPALFPFFQPYTFGKTTLFEIIVEVMAVVWLISRKGLFGPLLSAHKILLVLIGLFALSTALSSAVSESFWGSSARMDGFFTLLHFFAFFFILSSSFGETAWRRCMRISVIAGTFAALYAVAQWFDVSFVTASRGEVFGTLGNPSYLALYLLFTLFLARYLAERESKREIAILLYCAAAIQAIALVLTQVQAGMLALALGAMVELYPYALARFTISRGIIALVGVGMIIFLFSFSSNFAKLSSLSEGKASFSNRLAVWNIALSGIGEKPFLGHGANMFEPYYLAQKNKGAVMLPVTGEIFDKPHNAYLEIAFSYGIIGLVAYLFFIGAVFRRAWSIPAFAGALTAYLVFLFFFFDTFASLLMFFFIAAFLFAAPKNVLNENDIKKRGGSLAILIVGGIALIGGFFVFHFKPLYSAYFARQVLINTSATHAINETAKAESLRYSSFNTPFIERAILLAQRAMKK